MTIEIDRGTGGGSGGERESSDGSGYLASRCNGLTARELHGGAGTL
jgi:hypothetical protein